MSFEENLQRGLFSGTSEKSFVDKLLGREDVNNIREIMKKDDLSRSEMIDILSLLVSSEAKLVNYGENDRYIILKYFVWLREFAKVNEMLYDYETDMRERLGDRLAESTLEMFENNKRLMTHMFKFLVDLYLNIARTSLSTGATGFMELLNNKYEFAYPQGNPNSVQPQQPQLAGRGK